MKTSARKFILYGWLLIILGSFAFITTDGFCQTSAAADNEIEQLYAEGFVHLASSNFVSAVAVYRKLALLTPADYLPYHYLGTIYRRTGNFDEAVECIKRAYLLSPEKIKSQQFELYIQTMIAAGRLEEANDILADYYAIEGSENTEQLNYFKELIDNYLVRQQQSVQESQRKISTQREGQVGRPDGSEESADLNKTRNNEAEIIKGKPRFPYVTMRSLPGEDHQNAEVVYTFNGDEIVNIRGGYKNFLLVELPEEDSDVPKAEGWIFVDLLNIITEGGEKRIRKIYPPGVPGRVRLRPSPIR